jgi:hypothetical protein
VGTQPGMLQGTTIMQSEADRSRHCVSADYKADEIPVRPGGAPQL